MRREKRDADRHVGGARSDAGRQLRRGAAADDAGDAGAGLRVLDVRLRRHARPREGGDEVRHDPLVDGEAEGAETDARELAVDVDAEEVLVAARAERRQRRHARLGVRRVEHLVRREAEADAGEEGEDEGERRLPPPRLAALVVLPHEHQEDRRAEAHHRRPRRRRRRQRLRPRREVERAEEGDEEHPRARELHVVPADVLGVVRAQRAARRPLVAGELEPSPKLERDALARRGERRVEGRETRRHHHERDEELGRAAERLRHRHRVVLHLDRYDLFLVAHHALAEYRHRLFCALMKALRLKNLHPCYWHHK